MAIPGFDPGANMNDLSPDQIDRYRERVLRTFEITGFEWDKDMQALIICNYMLGEIEQNSRKAVIKYLIDRWGIDIK